MDNEELHTPVTPGLDQNKTQNLQQQNDPKPKIIAGLGAAFVLLLIIGTYVYFVPSPFGKPEPISSLTEVIPDDNYFAHGFVIDGNISKEYCDRMGYQYADFANNCFIYQYFDTYETYVNDEEGFRLFYPNLWIRDETPLNYSFVFDPKFSAIRDGVTCTISYGVVDEAAILSSGTASTSLVVYGGSGYGPDPSAVTNDSIYSLKRTMISFGRKVTKVERNAGYTDFKTVFVPHYPYAKSKYGFVLTSGDKQPLVKGCIDEFDNFLNYRALNYSPGSITNNSNGILAVQDVNSWFVRAAGVSAWEVTLLFENSKTGRAESLSSEIGKETSSITDAFLSGNKIYYINRTHPGSPTTNPVRSVDIFTGEVKELPLPVNAEEPVHSFYVRSDWLYYLTGKYCNEYRMRCTDMTLRRFNLKTDTTETLSVGLKTRRVVGLSAANDAVITGWFEGDAGCSWGSYESTNIATKTHRDLGNYSHCEGDVVDESLKFKDITPDTTSYNYFIVTGGKIILPKESTPSSGKMYVRVNKSEFPVLR